MDDGMLAITVNLDSKKNILLKDPELFSKGIIDQGSQRKTAELVALVKNAIIEKLQTKTSFAELKLLIKDVAGAYIYKNTKRHPIILLLVLLIKKIVSILSSI